MVKPRKQPKKVWMQCPSKVPKPKVPEAVKLEVETRAQTLIGSYLKPNHVRPPPAGLGSNYIVDIYGLRYRSFFYFCSKYCCPGPRSIAPFFEDRFARMEYLTSGRFNLAWMRHTGQWWPSISDSPLAECLHKIKTDPWFRPYV